MSIEKNIERIADALEKMTAGAVDLGIVIRAAQEATDAEEPEAPEAPAAGQRSGRKTRARKPAAPPAAEVTVDAVREALRTFLENHEPGDALAILKKFDATSVTTLAEEKYVAVLKELKAA